MLLKVQDWAILTDGLRGYEYLKIQFTAWKSNSRIIMSRVSSELRYHKSVDFKKFQLRSGLFLNFNFDTRSSELNRNQHINN
jgi:hypothetical protein